MKSAVRIFKYTILAVSVLIYGFFMFRLCSANAPRSSQRIVWNEITIAAYKADPAGFEAFTQPQETVITSDGRFWISDVIYLPQAKQLQLTIKYNNSTLKGLMEDLGTDTLPEEPFVFCLIDGNRTIYRDYSFVADKRLNYNYRTLVFENIDLSEISTMSVRMYYTENSGEDDTPYGSLLAWNKTFPTSPYKYQKELPDELK